MNELLNYTICCGLGLPVDQKQIPKILDTIPDSCFGVFVTARRTHEYYEQYKRKIKTHGCQGYWKNDYSELPKEKILFKLQDVAYTTTSNKDRRKTRFKKPIQQDAGANYEINFMMQPIFDIDTQTAKMSNDDKFNNTDYGLIFVSNDGKRSTYLPRTWVKKTWTEIKSMLKKKSGSTSGGKFYAYKTISYKGNVTNILKQDYLKFLTNEFTTYINNNYDDFVPYQIDSNNNITRDKHKNIRNIMSIDTILKFQSYLYPDVISNIKDNLNYYQNEFNKNKRLMRQASSFLSLASSKAEINEDGVEEICNYLYCQIPDLEPRFELGEVLISLNEISPRIDTLLFAERKMYNSLIENNIKIIGDDIFQYNWQSQYLYSLYKEHDKVFLDHAKILFRRMNYIVSGYNDKTEINYLAVAIEGMSSLLPFITEQETKTRLQNDMFYLFYLLQKRYKNGLYFFKNGNARIDITSHIINSYNNMIGELSEKNYIGV